MSYSGSSACNGSHWGYREQESRRAYPIAYCGPNQSSHVILMTIQWLRRVCISFVSKKLSTNESIMEQRSPTPQICKKPMFSTRFLISTLFLYSTRPPLIEFCRTVMWISTLHEEASRKNFPTTSVQGSDGSRWAGSKEPGMMSAWLRSWSWLSSSSSSSASFDGTWSVGGRDTGQGSMPLCSRIQFCLRVEGDRHRMAHRSWWW